MAKRRRSNSNELERFVVAVVALAGFWLYKSGHLGQVLYGLVILIFLAVLTVALFKLKKKEPALVHNTENAPTPHARRENPLQRVNELLAANPSLWQSEEKTLPSDIPQEWNAELLSSLEWKRFETVCTEYLRLIGHAPKETRIGADGGVDIWVYKEGQEKPIGIVQCKAWSTYKVGVKPVRELYGVMAAEGVANGKFITSGEFTSEAIAFAQGKRLELISGQRLLSAIKSLSPDKQRDLLAIAIEGDYTTPTCPQCGAKMTLRQGRKSNSRKFWGCPGYPRCRSTLVYKPAAA